MCRVICRVICRVCASMIRNWYCAGESLRTTLNDSLLLRNARSILEVAKISQTGVIGLLVLNKLLLQSLVIIVNALNCVATFMNQFVVTLAGIKVRAQTCTIFNTRCTAISPVLDVMNMKVA